MHPNCNRKRFCVLFLIKGAAVTWPKYGRLRLYHGYMMILSEFFKSLESQIHTNRGHLHRG